MDSHGGGRTSSRVRRQCKPSTSWYVGYTEDDESVEMIEKKFEMMERLRQEREASSARTSHHEGGSGERAGAVPPAGDGAMAAGGHAMDEIEAEAGERAHSGDGAEHDEGATLENGTFATEELEQLFIMTSTFTLDRIDDDFAYLDDEYYSGEDEYSGDEEDEEEEDEDAYDQAYAGSGLCSSYDGELNLRSGDASLPSKRTAPVGAGDGPSGKRRSQWPTPLPTGGTRTGGGGRPRGHRGRVGGRSSANAPLVHSCCVPQVEPEYPEYQRVPAGPMPSTLCRTIAPFSIAPDPERCYYVECEDVTSFDLRNVRPAGGIMGILMDVPWGEGFPEALAKFDFARAVAPGGFLFCWVAKEWIAKLLHFLEAIGFCFVEKLVWVMCHANNRIVREPSRFLHQSKTSLMIFRAPTQSSAKGVDLRHQRNPDVIFDFVQHPLSNRTKPEFVYEVIETLLERALEVLSESGKFHLVELWAPRLSKREGWASIAQAPS